MKTSTAKNGSACDPIFEARRAIDELEANGATFTYRPAHNSLPPTFVYEIPGSGDRQRCRAIILKAKAEPKVWAAVLSEIASRTGAAS